MTTLLATRAAWILVCAVSLAVFAAGVPVRYAQYLTPEDEIRVGLKQLGYAEQYIEQYGSEAAAKEAMAPLGLTPAGYARLFLTLEVAVALIYVLVGGVVARRKFDDPFGLFASLFLVAFGVGGSSYLLLPLSLASPAGFVFAGLVTTMAYSLMPPFFYLFPDGRWVPRWGWIPASFWACTTLVWNLAPESSINPTNWPLWLFALNLLFIWGSAFGAQFYRYFRISLPAQRQQTKWLVAGFGLTAGLLLPPPIMVWLFFPAGAAETFYSVMIPLQVVLLAIIPVTLGISIVRYRLWDIDLFIRRTLVYSILSALLALTYVGLIVVLQNLFATVSNQQSPVIIAISTLAIAALFFPLRRRVQGFIDRGFYRRKYDAQKVLAEFAAAARDETDLDNLTARLVDVVGETMQPESACLWLKPIAATLPADGDSR